MIGPVDKTQKSRSGARYFTGCPFKMSVVYDTHFGPLKHWLIRNFSIAVRQPPIPPLR